MAERKTISDFRMIRQITTPKVPASTYRFLRGVIDPINIDEWEDCKITDSTTELGVDYSLSIPQKAFVIREAFLVDEDTEERYTEMRAWQVIVDSWLAGQTNQPDATVDGLQYLAFADVWETVSKKCMDDERDQQIKAGTIKLADLTRVGGNAVIVLPEGTTWTNNPWIRCAERVAKNLSLTAGHQIRVIRALAIYPGPPSLVVEFGPAPAEEEPAV